MMFHEHYFRALNTDVTACVWSTYPNAARYALRQVERFFREVHARFTRFDASSELSALNRANGQPCAASADMLEVVSLAQRYSQATAGWFNPTILGALEAAGYDRTFEAIGTGDVRSGGGPAAMTSAAAIEIDHTRQTITLPIGTRLDLGGIVKGWAVQRAAQELSVFGPCLVDAGGDLQTLGAAPDSPYWPIELCDPFDHEATVLTVQLRDQAVATSGTDRRRWQRNGVWQHHLIDPHTGRPSTSDLITATVIAPTAVEAEVYAKAVFLQGAAAGLKFVATQPSLAACVITADGEVKLSETMQEYVDVYFTYADALAA